MIHKWLVTYVNGIEHRVLKVESAPMSLMTTLHSLGLVLDGIQNISRVVEVEDYTTPVVTPTSGAFDPSTIVYGNSGFSPNVHIDANGYVTVTDNGTVPITEAP